MQVRATHPIMLVYDLKFNVMAEKTKIIIGSNKSFK